jgi:hypothetical protein
MVMCVEMAGKRYGKLLVLEKDGVDKRTKAMWICQCDCGKKKRIAGANLRRGVTRSCGCGRGPKAGK